MSYYESTTRITLPVSADLSADMYKFVTMTSTGLALNTLAGGPCIGVLDTNDADALGKRASLAILGVTKVEASAAIAAGARVSSTALGLAVTATTDEYSQGTALVAAAAAGDIIPVLLGKENTITVPAAMTPSAVITASAGSVVSSAVRTGNFIKTTYVIDITGLKSSTTDLDIIGDTGISYLGQLTAAVNGNIFAGQVGCSVVPLTGADDIDLYSAVEGTGAFDAGIATLDETALVTSGGAHAIGTVKPMTALPAADEYLYLTCGEAGTVGTYTAGTLIIELWGTVA